MNSMVSPHVNFLSALILVVTVVVNIALASFGITGSVQCTVAGAAAQAASAAAALK